MKQFLKIALLCFYSVSLVHAQELKTENVILITLDGLRWQEVFSGADPRLLWKAGAAAEEFSSESSDERRQLLMPFFWDTVVNEGIVFGNRSVGNRVDVTNRGAFSYPGYNEILTGFADDSIDSNDKVPNKNVTVLEWVNQQPGFIGRVAAFTSWDVFPFIINEERSGVPVNAGFEATSGQITDREAFLNRLQVEVATPWAWERFDVFTHYMAMEYLARKRPRLLYIGFGDTDEYAHSDDYGAYLKATRQTDDFIRDLWIWLQEDETYKGKTSLVITTDHGRGYADRWIGHGSDWVGSAFIWMAILGPDTPAGGEFTASGQFFQNQIAATVAALLGLVYTNVRETGPPIDAAIR
ncbi:MAG: hypothetical protein BMS9Abin05_0229 [Rhodothermia bacterium]|nr:MAG: hypothetical protein BMS9Abin05_0229 [Rhodothermia bacterium]